MKLFLMVLVLAGLIFGYLGFFLVSTVAHDPKIWHIDPLKIAQSDSPNDYRVAPENATKQPIDRVAPVYDERAMILAQAWDDFVLSQMDTVRIAGLPSELLMTYVQRTPRLKFPDYITVQFIERDDGLTTIAIYSRSRYGQGDMGVNKARVDTWLKNLEAFEIKDEK